MSSSCWCVHNIPNPKVNARPTMITEAYKSVPGIYWFAKYLMKTFRRAYTHQPSRLCAERLLRGPCIFNWPKTQECIWSHKSVSHSGCAPGKPFQPYWGLYLRLLYIYIVCARQTGILAAATKVYGFFFMRRMTFTIYTHNKTPLIRYIN